MRVLPATQRANYKRREKREKLFYRLFMVLPSFSWVNETASRMRGGVTAPPYSFIATKAFTVAEVHDLGSFTHIKAGITLFIRKRSLHSFVLLVFFVVKKTYIR